jgi:hypothetical protein
VGFDPSEFTVGNTFVSSDRTYNVSRAETLNDTPWGQSDTYVIAAYFANATYSYSWTSWCDAKSGLFLKNIDESRTPTFTSYEEQELIETGVENDRFDVVRNGQFYQVLVNTNCTLDGFEFDSSNNVITLTVEEPEGVSGMCNITVPKGIVPAGNSFEVNVDGQKANSTLTEDTSNFYVSVNYQNNAHTITVAIVGNSFLTYWWIWTIAIVIVILLAGTVYFSRKSRHRRRRKSHS